VLLCLPDAGGNAINFQHLADTAADRVRVLAVELPGHDLARPEEEPVTLPRLTGLLAEELTGRSGLYLWGQGAGAAAALATAQALERAGTEVAGVIVAWDDTTPGAGVASGVTELSDDEVADLLRRRRAYVEVDGAVPRRLAFVARAYRHDWVEALRVLDRLAGEPGLACPVTELTLGTAAPRLRQDAARVHRQHLATADGDVARHHPDVILRVLERWRSRVAAPA
jgi:surfactin synthase thioesterase subunit